MAKTATEKEIDRLNGVILRAQTWVETNFPDLREPLRSVISEAQKNKVRYSALTGLMARCIYEGEAEAMKTLDREYILTDYVRDIVRRMKDEQEDTDERLRAWDELKELLDIK